MLWLPVGTLRRVVAIYIEKRSQLNKQEEKAASFPLLSVFPPGCQPLFLAFAVCVKIFLALGSIVIVALEALKTELGGLLTRIIVLTVSL